ncbi:MAG: hypothetical protein ABWK15_01700 [Dissulfuribacterales bacterium]
MCLALLLAGCVPPQSASDTANQQADKMMYQPISYVNASKPGPALVVIPGEIKSNNATFTQKVSSNNVADYAELELGKANFKILERADLGPMLDEIRLAVNMGDPNALQKFKKGKFKSTQWFVKFDILKAEPVAQASQGFNGAVLGSIAGALIGGRGGAVTDTSVSSVRAEDAAGVWIIGMRYKILNANTSEQVATGYFEDKMELNAGSTSVLGISQSQQKTMTLDTMVQRLVQKCVAEIDSRNK